MRNLIGTLLLLTTQMVQANVNCSADGDQVTIDPKREQVEIVRNGKTTKLQILSQNPHAYRLFGESTYQLQDGYVLGLKATKSKSKKNLTVFKEGEPIASLADCSVK